MMVSNAYTYDKNKFPSGPMIGHKTKPKQTTIGPMYALSENDIKYDHYLKNSCYWFIIFLEVFSSIVKTAKFLELRPGPDRE